MHVRTKLVVNKGGVSSDVFSRIADMITSDGRRRSILYIDMVSTDPRLRNILHMILTNSGTPWSGQTLDVQRLGSYSFRQYRVYSHDDWQGHELLRLNPLEHRYPCSDDAEVMERTAEGLARVAVDEIPPGVDFLRAHGVSALVPHRVRFVLEQAGLYRLRYRPTVPVRVVDELKPIADCSWNEFPEPWWELTSDLVLPPVSPSMALVSWSGKPIVRGSTDMCAASDGSGFLGFPELRYLRAEVEALGSFDLAHVFERSSPSTLDRALVASRRFYEVCREHDLGVNWIPVHLEDQPPPGKLVNRSDCPGQVPGTE